MSGYIDHVLAICHSSRKCWQNLAARQPPMSVTALRKISAFWTPHGISRSWRPFGVLGGAKTILVLPGSRSGEVRRHAPIFGEAVGLLRQRGMEMEVSAAGHQPRCAACPILGERLESCTGADRGHGRQVRSLCQGRRSDSSIRNGYSGIGTEWSSTCVELQTRPDCQIHQRELRLVMDGFFAEPDCRCASRPRILQCLRPRSHDRAADRKSCSPKPRAPSHSGWISARSGIRCRLPNLRANSPQRWFSS